MALDFTIKDLYHKITAQFMHTFLPDAKKPYNLRAVHQPELDIHGIASKAEVYNITTPPKVIEEGFNAAIELIYYLTADGYRIKTPLFNLKIRVPGEYDGTESLLPAGVFPEARLRPSADYRGYLRSRVQVQIDGKGDAEGYIARAVDGATGLVDEVITAGNLLTLYGYGLKIDHDEDHAAQSGVFFRPPAGSPVKAQVIAVNKPRTLKVIAPPGLAEGTAYTVYVVTQGSAKHTGTLLKELREAASDFTLVARK
jgi:hypothetical protein